MEQMKLSNKQWFVRGLKAGVPIGLGYLAVAFTLGIAARNAGMTAFQATLTSFLINASAGEFVGFTLIGADGKRMFWKEGDELPPASEEAEALLRSKIESGYCIPVEEWRRRIEAGEIEFG